MTKQELKEWAAYLAILAYVGFGLYYCVIREIISR